jgi:hypothetical protein
MILSIEIKNGGKLEARSRLSGLEMARDAVCVARKWVRDPSSITSSLASLIQISPMTLATFKCCALDATTSRRTSMNVSTYHRSALMGCQRMDHGDS